ncbi:Fc.00g026920.m01.CDS01 [Cosmosporella sp. VM-42]
MTPTTLVMAALFTLAQFTSPAVACNPPPPNDTSGFPPFEFGSDAPSDPATIGYFINHFSLNVRNLTASLEFYSSVFGLRHIFTLQASKHLSIAYMGHSQGGRNGTGYQTTAEINSEKNNNAGSLEMLYLDIPNKDLPASSEKSTTFGHIGIIVPDVEATQARLEGFPGVRILKNTGAPTPSEGEIAIANGFSQATWDQIDDEERKVIETVLSTVNERFIYVADPDGNIIEVQPQY